MHRFTLSAAVTSCILALAACGTSAPAPAQCAAGEVLCSGVCTSLLTSQSNCGGCGIACQAPGNGGTTACVGGACQPACAAPLGLCNARTDAGASGLACTDTSADPVNCGACGQVCAPQQTCNAGHCTSCPSGELQCPTTTPGRTACKAVLSDNLNCGGCGAVCSSPSSCQDGACVAPGLSNCGNADGGPALQKDLQNDPANCGACGNACLATEVCRAGACSPCPGAACGNLCVDVSTDARNCGACAVACTGTQACVGGICAQPVKVTITNPTQSLVPTVSLPLSARVDSALPMQSVTYVSILPDGGDSPATALAFDSSLNPVGVPSSAWTSAVPGAVTDGGTLAVIARDIAWRADAGDAPLHQDRAQVGPLQLLAPPMTTPTLTATQAGAALASASWVPLNTPPITFTATGLGTNAASVQFINRGVSDTYVIGTATAAGGSASLTVTPAELTSINGAAQIVACPVDVAGQVTAIASCSNGASTNTIFLTAGRVPVPSGNAFPVLTAKPDGSAPTVWFMGTATSGSAQLIAATTTTTASAVPSTPVVGTAYAAGYLQPAPDTSASVLALRFDGTALDRFDCATGASCNRTPYVSTSGSFKLATVPVATATTILFTDGPVQTGQTGQYLYANNPAPSGGSAPAAAQPVPGTPVFPYTGGTLGTTAAAQASGAVVFYTQASLTGGPYQLRIAHPNISGGSQALGPSHAGAPVFLQVFPSGEIVWQYLDGAGGSLLEAADYDGVSAAAKVANVSTQFATNASAAWQVVRPQMLLGLAADKTSTSSELIQIDLNRSGAIQIGAPSPISSTVGALAGSNVRQRNRSLGVYAVSDDQRKAIYVTSDPGPLLTLWLLDLASGVANQLYSTPNLDTSDAAPRFVHSAAGSVSPLPGGTPSAGLAQVPAILWGEDLASPVNNGLNEEFRPMRLFYALYRSDGSVSSPVAVDRIAYAVTNSGALPLAYTVDSSVGASLFFLSGSTSEPDLYSVPLTGSGTSALVIDRPSGYLLREDKGRFLVQRSDGITFAGRLQAGTTPASTLVPIAFDGNGGPIPVYSLLSSLTTFGFTADGDHAWALSQVESNTLVSGGQPVLRFIDLGTLVHQNLGAEAFQISVPTLGAAPEPLPCFLGNAAFAIGLTNLADDSFSGLAAIYAASTTTGVHRDPGLPAISDGQGRPPVCQVAIDDTEAVIAPGNGSFGAPTTGPVYSALALSGGLVSATNLAGARVSGPSQIATYSPIGGPYLHEYDLVQIPRSGSTQNFFKVWGESAAQGGKAFPFVPVAAGGTLLQSTARPSDQNAALLLMLQVSGAATVPGAIPVAVPLAGKAAPVAPLP